jgi:hypothetical protein
MEEKETNFKHSTMLLLNVLIDKWSVDEICLHERWLQFHALSKAIGYTPHIREYNLKE